MATDTPTHADPWNGLRSLTPARIALGRAGISLPTRAQLDFQFAHAQARDAVHTAFDSAGLATRLQEQGYETLEVQSAAEDRARYLQRPDLGRQLDGPSAERLDSWRAQHSAGYDLAIVIADGLSALAVHRHSAPLLQRFAEQCAQDGWTLAPVVLAHQGRVAIGDEIGERLGARMLVVLIGERPGLSSPDSLGVYYTYGPRQGLSDAQRNCISNVRPEGLGYGLAAHKLVYLLRESGRRQLSGVKLKDEAELALLEGEEQAGSAVGNFLLRSDES